MPDRYRLSPADLLAVRTIAARYVGGLARVEHVPSNHNVVCRLRGSDGRRRVLKLARDGVSEPGLVREPRIYELLRHRGVPVPKIDREDAIGALVGRPWFLAEDAGRRTAADPSGLSPVNRRNLFAQVGRLLAEVHELAFDRPADFHGGDLVAPTFDRSPLQSWHRRHLPIARRMGLLDGVGERTLANALVLGAARSEPLPDALSPIASSTPARGELLARLPTPGRFTLCHGDFNPSQCVRRNANVSAVVDWESAHVGDPAYDLAAFEVMLRVTTPAELAGAAMAGYREVRPVPPEQEAAYRPVQIAHAASLAVVFHRAHRNGPYRAAKNLLSHLTSPQTQAA